jgi:hypothetical protein
MPKDYLGRLKPELPPEAGRGVVPELVGVPPMFSPPSLQ